MDLVGYACALVLALVFVWAGVAKLMRVEETRAAFAALGVPKSAVAARVVPAMELLLAAMLVAVPRPGAVFALLGLLAFNFLLMRALKAGVTTPCNCFGSRHADPVSRRDLRRNAGLMALAVSAVVLT